MPLHYGKSLNSGVLGSHSPCTPSGHPALQPHAHLCAASRPASIRGKTLKLLSPRGCRATRPLSSSMVWGAAEGDVSGSPQPQCPARGARCGQGVQASWARRGQGHPGVGRCHQELLSKHRAPTCRAAGGPGGCSSQPGLHTGGRGGRSTPGTHQRAKFRQQTCPTRGTPCLPRPGQRSGPGRDAAACVCQALSSSRAGLRAAL